MRVAMVAACPFPWPRGTPVRIHRMAEALVERGHDVHVITYHLGDRAIKLPFAVHRIRDVPSYTLCEPGPTLRKLFYLDPLLVGKLRRTLAMERFDILHAHHYEGLLAALMVRKDLRNTPLIYDAHTLLASELPYYRLGMTRRVKAAIGRMLDTRLPRQADHIIAVSDEIRDSLVRRGGVSESAITLIRNGVETGHFSAPDSARRSAAAPCLVFAGNLAAYQGIDLMLRAFALIRKQCSVARLVLLTNSSFEPYEGLARSLGIRSALEISPTTYQTLPAQLGDADVLLNPRTACDGLPQKLLNYMAAARPIVSFAGSAKLLEHEHSGLVVPDGNVEEFAAAAMRLLAAPDLGARLGTNARYVVTAEYSWQQIAARVEAVYQRLSGRPADRAR